jgi:magnesium-transporting ATPase (P-type)
MSQSTPSTRARVIHIATWLLLGQGLALLTLGILNFLNLGIGSNLTPEEAFGIFFKGLNSSIVFIALACISFVATFNFWRMDNMAWMMGILTQGLTLLTALIIYFEGLTTIYAYAMMAYGIFMVIYLHLPDIIGTLRQANEGNR